MTKFIFHLRKLVWIKVYPVLANIPCSLPLEAKVENIVFKGERLITKVKLFSLVKFMSKDQVNLNKK